MEALAEAARGRAEPFYYRDDDKNEVDLVLEFGPGVRWAIEIKHGRDPAPGRGFYAACEAIAPQQRFIIHRGEAGVSVGQNVLATTLSDALSLLDRAVR